MFDSITELLEKIRLGEDGLLELKEIRFNGGRVSGPSRDSLADEFAALANTKGGVVVLGVDDQTRTILGIPLQHLDTVEDFIRECCTDKIEPKLPVHIERCQLPDASGLMQPVIRVDVPRSLFVHKSPSGYLHRIGSAKRVMSTEYFGRLFQQRSQTRIIRFDEQAVAESTLADLESKLWKKFLGPKQQGEESDLLAKLGMARQDDDGTMRPTLAGILMACPEPRRFVPNAYIQAVAYRGTGIATGSLQNYQKDAKDLSGPLDQQIAAACKFVADNSKLAASKSQGRHDQPEYDPTVVFEAVVNAVAHRDYAIYGSKIRLRLFDDRLEIYSPGAIANTLTVDALAYRQFSRNETLTSLLARCPVPEGLETDRARIMDKRGEGVPLILDRSESLSGQRPSYRLIDESELLLTISAAMEAPEK
ncbi:MAG: transcriptional regulator [Planctomycetota bacterium]|nr:MAG: transcriptional regulator [Planctomycetota bacterium]